MNTIYNLCFFHRYTIIDGKKYALCDYDEVLKECEDDFRCFDCPAYIPRSCGVRIVKDTINTDPFEKYL